VKNTWEDHPDYKSLCSSVELVRSVAEHINSAGGDDNADRMWELQLRLGEDCGVCVCVDDTHCICIAAADFDRTVLEPRCSVAVVCC
jgi:hypothetical protein